MFYCWHEGVCRSCSFISSGIEEVSAFPRREQIEEAAEGIPQSVDGSRRGLGQEPIELREGFCRDVAIRHTSSWTISMGVDHFCGPLHVRFCFGLMRGRKTAAAATASTKLRSSLSLVLEQ